MNLAQWPITGWGYYSITDGQNKERKTMKKYFTIASVLFLGIFAHQTQAQSEWAVRGNAFGYFVGELNAQVEYRPSANFGINVFGGARPFELSYLDDDLDASRLANKFVGLEARIYTKEIAGMNPFLMPYIKYSYYNGDYSTATPAGNFQTRQVTDHYVYMGLGAGLRQQLAEHFFTEVTFSLARGVYGNIRDQDGLRIIPESARFDVRIGVLFGYTFGK
jgi:hypothetical protein